jgi:ribosomal protein S18 acetylase RimI-like enzyme
MPGRASIEERIQGYLRSVVERRREPVDAGAFILYVHPTERHPYLNYAIPRHGAREGDGEALVRAARERGLVPRLEYLDGCFPWVEAALAAAGFVREGRLRLMTCTPETLTPPDHGVVELVRVEPGSALVAPMLAVQHDAFGDPPPSDETAAAWDGQVIAALLDGVLVGAADWTPVIDGMSEIAGVAVAQAARRRGIGSAVTAAAARAAFEQGATLALLTPGSDESARVYERAGFSDTTTIVHLRVPCAGAQPLV